MSRIQEVQEKLKSGGVEVRTFNTTDELRAAMISAGGENDPLPKIEGYAAVFNSPSDNLGYFVETIRAGAFDGADFSMCKSVWNHNDDIVLGSMSGNTLKLEVTERGLFYSTTPPDTQFIRDTVIEVMRRGDVDKSSFRFVVAEDGDEWRYDAASDTVYRSITKIESVIDVSPVTFPAYNVANSALRSAENTRKIETEIDAKSAQIRENFLLNSI